VCICIILQMPGRGYQGTHVMILVNIIFFAKIGVSESLNRQRIRHRWLS
jgi:predicted transporter